MSTLVVGNEVVGYVEDGDDESTAPPVLFIPGTSMDRTAWDMVRAELPAGLRCVTVELPGSGESSMPTAPLTVEGIADQAAEVMVHLGHDRYHVAGYSLGAVIALGIAAREAAHVASATALCGWATTDTRMKFTFGLWQRLIAADPALFMRYAVADGFTANAIAGLEPMLEDVVALGAAALAPGTHEQLDLDAVVDITGLLGAITAPTLIIGAAEDRWVDIVHSQDLHQRIDGSRLEILPAGHIVIQELAGEVAKLLAAHLSGS